MSVMNKPDYKIFAQDAKSGEYVAFPDILRGWGITLEQYGGFPPMELFNSAAKRIDEWLMYLTQRGLPEWDAAVDYPKDAMIQHAGVYYVSLKTNKGEQPNNSQASWKKLTEVFGVDGKLAKDQNGADIPDKPKFLDNIGLVPAVVLPKGYNIPFHIRNTPGILYSAQYPGTYTNEPDFGGEWFDVYSARHTSGTEGACTFIAVSRKGKVATASLIDTTFSGWNRIIDGTNTTAAGRDIISKNSAAEMVGYLGLDVIPGRLLNVVTFKTSGTYTPSPGTKSIIVEAVGGGGASGNLGATGSNQNAVSAAGSNGAYAKARYTGGFSAVSVTIGAGGTVLGGGGGAGGDAGKTSFGSLLNCPGGKGSKAGQPKSPPFNEGAAQPSGSPTGSGIIIAKGGMYSSWPTVVGLGMASNFANAIPSLLGEYGLGGDGVASGVSEPAVNGNAGNSGVVIVWEYS